MKHILIVDDALDLGRLLQTALVMVDPAMPVIVVPSAEEAILEASHSRLDLLITDLNLPGMSGIDLVNKIRKYHPDVHVIVITGMNDDELIQQVKALNVDALINKPMSIPDFIETAKRILEDKDIEQLADTPGSDLQEQGETHLADVLTNLRSQLGAKASILLDDSGKILANSGELSDDIFRSAWFSDMLNTASMLSVLSGHLGRTKPEAASVLKGEKISLVFTPVGRFVLLIILDGKGSHLRLARAFEETISAQALLLDILQGMGISLASAIPTHLLSDEKNEEFVPVVESETETAIQADLEDFEKLFSSAASGIDAEQLDSFWEETLEVQNTGPLNPDVLSFDEASQLGLTPDEL